MERVPIPENGVVSEAAKLGNAEIFGRALQKRNLAPALAGMFLSACVSGSEKPRIPAEIEPRMSWEEGLGKLRRDVYYESGEMQVGVVATNKEIGWADVTTVAGNTEAGADLERLRDMATKEFQADEVRRVCLVHTHTLEAAKASSLISDNDAGQLRMAEAGGKSTTFSVPPSIGDISNRGILSSTFSEFGKRDAFVTGAFDPSGVWYYRTAREHEFDQHPEIKEELMRMNEVDKGWEEYLIAELGKLPDAELGQLVLLTYPQAAARVEKFKQKPGVTPEKIRIAEEMTVLHNILSSDPEVVGRFFADPSARQRYEEWKEIKVEGYARNMESLDTAKQEYTEASKEGVPDEELRARLKEAYLLNGMAVRYASYDDLAHEPACAGVDYNPDLKK